MSTLDDLRTALNYQDYLQDILDDPDEFRKDIAKYRHQMLVARQAYFGMQDTLNDLERLMRENQNKINRLLIEVCAE